MELYEELPDGEGPIQEELKEDLPGSTFSDAYPYLSPSPTSGAPPPLPSGPITKRNWSDALPPLPSGPIPQRNRPPSMRVVSPPPLPTQAPATFTSSTNTLPYLKKDMTKQQKAATVKLKASPKSTSARVGGIDMNEFLKKARSRSNRPFEELENKTLHKEDDEDRHTASLLNQLQKMAPAPTSKPKSSEDASPLWVKKNEQQEDAPEFIKKAHNITKPRSGSDEISSQPSLIPPPVPPRPAVKPRVMNPPRQEPKEDNTLTWLKQRKRQFQLVKMGGPEGEQKPPPPALAPRPGMASPPTISQSGQSRSQYPLPPSKKTRPVPLPRKSTLSALPEVTNPQTSMFPPPPPGSVRGRAMTLERHTSGSHKFSKNSPIVPPKPVPYRAVPTAEPAEAPPPLLRQQKPLPPIPRQITPLVLARGGRTAPQPPITSPPPTTIPQRDMAPSSNKPPPPIPSPLPPAVLQRDMLPPTATSPPPTVPQRDTPPVGSKIPPHFPVSPRAELPSPITTSRGELPPPVVSLRYHYRPLPPVDLYNPPIISRSTKPRIPGSEAYAEERGEIYGNPDGVFGGELPAAAVTTNKQLSMASGKTTREYLTFRRNLSLIIDSLAATVDPARLAVKLLEVDLITDDVVGHASVTRVPTRERIQPIVMAIMSQIQLDISNFQLFVGELRTFHPRLAERLEKFHTSDLELNVMNAVTDVQDWQTLAQQLDYDPIHQQELRACGQNQEHCRKEMLTTWAKKDQRASWKKLAESLDRMEHQQAAQRIREDFIPTIYNQDQTDEEEIDQPTSTPAMSKYGEYLRRIYTRQALSYESKYSPKSTQKYINLAMISKHKESRAELDAFTRATIRGDVDDVIEMKTEITPRDIGRLEDGSPAQCILVQGAPGVGKTTLAWEACHQWGKGVLFSEYLLVMLLKMRDQSIQKATTLSDLFKHPNPELQAAVCKDVVERNGKSTLILLEGYDELPPDIQERSIFSALIEGKELPNATIFVTSRTSSSDIVYKKCKNTNFQHIEVVGFTREQIESYIKNTVADEKVLEAFRHYLKKYPHIHGLMYIPLNCGIILDVFISSSDDEEPPTTQTELYTVLTKTILYRYLSSHPVHGKQKWRLSAFSDLPQDVHSNFLQLCEIAYEGILSNRLIFSDIPTDQETLGFMQSVPELYESKATSAVSHNFLHLTLQEFLSAVHISTFSQRMFVKTLENMFGKKHLTVVLQFLAGLTKLAPQKGSFTSKARAFFSKSPVQCVKSLQRDALGFIDTLHWLFEAQEKELLSQVLGRNVQDRDLSSQFLSPFDCYAIGYCIANSQCIWKLNLKSCSITEEGMNMFTSNGDGSFHGVAVLNLNRNSIDNQGGTALSIALKDSAVLGELRLGLCSIGLDGTTELMETLKMIHTLQVLDISGSTVGLTAGKNLAHLFANGNLSELNISYCSIESGTICDLARALHGNSKLQDLWLRGNPVGEAGAEAIASMLQHNNHLKLLDLTGCSSIGRTGGPKLITAMCQNVSLKILHLPDSLKFTGKATEGYETVQSRIQWTSDISTQKVVELMGSDINSFIVSALRWNSVLTKLTLKSVDAGGIAKLASVLHELSTLKTLELKDCRMSSGGAKHIATVLRGSHALTDLILWNCDSDGKMMSHLHEGISKIPTLRVLNLSDNSLGTEAARHLATALRGSHALTDLILCKCGINSTVMSHLCEGIANHPTLRVLNLGWNSLGAEGARHLATALRGSHGLTDLILWDCGINETALFYLHEGISIIPTLRVLDLSYNSLGTEGSKCLVRILKSSCSLTELDLRNCDLGGAADVARLLEALKENTTVTKLSLSQRYGNTVTSSAVYCNIKDRVRYNTSTAVVAGYVF